MESGFTVKFSFNTYAGHMNPSTNQVLLNGTVYDSACDVARLLKHAATISYMEDGIIIDENPLFSKMF